LRTAGEAEIRAWLRTRKKRGGNDPIGTRRRDNLRDAVVRLYSFAGEREYLTNEEAAVAENIPRIAQRGDVSTFSPKEIALLLEHVSPRWFPWFVIAAFAGLRTSEIFRLEWKHIYWDVKDEEGHPKPVIGVPRRIAKKVRISRKVPMLANLQDLLQPYRNLVGPLCPHKKWRTLEDQHQDELNRLAKVTGLQWKNNVLRHSFGSHRLAIVKNIEQVAWEMGNSAPMVRESYNDPKDETEAKSYFAIRRPDHENVVTMPLGLQFAS
jgi:integrase